MKQLFHNLIINIDDILQNRRKTESDWQEILGIKKVRDKKKTITLNFIKFDLFYFVPENGQRFKGRRR